MPSNGVFEWERPLVELEQRLADLKAFSAEQGVELTEEIAALERQAQRLRQELYSNLTPWQRVIMARHSGRPTFLDYVALIFEDFIELHGDRHFGDDAAMVGGLARFEGRPVTVIGTQKGRDTKENLRRNFGLPHPEGYRKALRLMRQAEKFGRPVITFIDVVGAFPGIEAEQRGQGVAIAENIMAMTQLRTSIVCVVTGEGGSGGALAIGVGDRVYMLEHAWYSVISPEMCATILWRDSSRAPEAAAILKLTARDLLELGVIDGVIPEPPGGAHRDHRQTAEAVRATLRTALAQLDALDLDERVRRRFERYRRMGAWVEGEKARVRSAGRPGGREDPRPTKEAHPDEAAHQVGEGGVPSTHQAEGSDLPAPPDAGEAAAPSGRAARSPRARAPRRGEPSDLGSGS